MNARSDIRAPVDVCLIVEGCYPFVLGGVSAWLDWLMRKQPEMSFGVVALTADEKPRESKYAFPPNLAFLDILPLSRTPERPKYRQPQLDKERLVDALCAVIRGGDLAAFTDLIDTIAKPTPLQPLPWLGQATALTQADLLNCHSGWEIMAECYARLCPTASFPDFFWAWRSLIGGLFAVLTAPVPAASVYHAISTGYAGLYAARAAVSGAGKSIITEHGIYCIERRIDLVVAEWIKNTLPVDLSCRDTRQDVRDIWTETFDSFAKVAYQASSRVTTLYSANQMIQRALGAEPEKLRVIPNGIDLKRFDGLAKPAADNRPTVALIGRVVPIKDIEAFIAAAAEIRRAIPDVLVLVIGPTDEDEAYFDLCKRRVAELRLGDTVQFTGRVDILDVLPRIDVLALTSISEAQPLVLLEAGAARIACVVTDVGSCREIIEGAPDESPNLGSAGRVVPPMDSGAIGRAVVELLQDPVLRRNCGETLRKRVELSFTSLLSAVRYRTLYQELGAS